MDKDKTTNPNWTIASYTGLFPGIIKEIIKGNTDQIMSVIEDIIDTQKSAKQTGLLHLKDLSKYLIPSKPKNHDEIHDVLATFYRQYGDNFADLAKYHENESREFRLGDK